MGQYIDLLGSFIIGGYVILMILTTNFRMQDSANQYYQNTFVQAATIGAAETVEYDFYKMGYRKSTDRITVADSATIKFRGDINNDNVIDSVSYYISDQNVLSYSSNPNDRQLLRKYNNDISIVVAYLTAFKLAYYDSMGILLKPYEISTQAGRNRIKMIQIYIKCELPDPIGGNFAPVEWRKFIKPKNLI